MKPDNPVQRMVDLDHLFRLLPADKSESIYRKSRSISAICDLTTFNKVVDKLHLEWYRLVRGRHAARTHNIYPALRVKPTVSRKNAIPFLVVEIQKSL